MTKSRPLPFSPKKAPWIASLEPGRKFQTRRPIKPQPKIEIIKPNRVEITWKNIFHRAAGGKLVTPEDMINVWAEDHCPHGVPGDKIWVREAYRFHVGHDDKKPSEVPTPLIFESLEGELTTIKARVFYEDDGKPPEYAGRYRHARYMPRWASRSTAKIIEVRAEPVQAISFKDILVEGFLYHYKGELSTATTSSKARAWFIKSWDKFYADTEFAWKHNPLAWVLILKKE